MFDILLNHNTLVLFGIIFFGIALGSIKIYGLNLGLSGVLFVALAAGHYRLAIPNGVGQLGLALFVYCVGLSAGNRFFSAIAKQGSKLAVMSAVIVGVSALFTCGHSSAETLHKLGILTIGDLAKTDPAILEAHLKSHGRCLWQYANGIDDSTVVLAPSKAKGIGNSTTLSSDATTKEEACKVLLSLCESVGRRLRASHQLAGQICTEIRYSDFRNVSHQMPIDIPTASVNLLYEDACALFDELWDSTPIRLLGIRTSKLVPEDEPVQLSLFDFPAPRSEKQQKLDAALDNIRAKYGKDAIKRGRFL